MEPRGRERHRPSPKVQPVGAGVSIEQLRHRLTNVGPKGHRCSVDQNTLKRTNLDDLESPAVAAHPLRVACYFGGTSFRSSKDLQKQVPPGKTRHERKETERFKSFTYEELIKRCKELSLVRLFLVSAF